MALSGLPIQAGLFGLPGLQGGTTMLAQGREGLPLFMGMALAKPLTNAIYPSRHYSTSSSKRTTPPLWTNWPSRVNPYLHMSTGNLRLT